MPEYWTPINSRYPRCVDPRPTVMIVRWEWGGWKIAARGEVATADRGPQFPGGTLGIVRALEVIGGLPRDQAIELTEQVSAEIGLGLQFHLDDDGGRIDLGAMNDAAVNQLLSAHTTGCGFVAHSWEAQAPDVIREVVRRGWRVHFVTGPQRPAGAWINRRAGQTFDSAAAAAAGTPCFNLDVPVARYVFAALERQLPGSSFASRADAWLLEAYRGLVPILGAPWVAERA